MNNAPPWTFNRNEVGTDLIAVNDAFGKTVAYIPWSGNGDKQEHIARLVSLAPELLVVIEYMVANCVTNNTAANDMLRTALRKVRHD